MATVACSRLAAVTRLIRPACGMASIGSRRKLQCAVIAGKDDLIWPLMGVALPVVATFHAR